MREGVGESVVCSSRLQCVDTRRRQVDKLGDLGM